MARPDKIGLEYWPFDVDFFQDEKIAAISGEFGIKGEITVVHLLCAIYRQGYFIEWSEMLQMKLLRELPGISIELLRNIVTRLVKWEFFDESLFDSSNVLTSKAIQRRYIAATSRRKGAVTVFSLLSDDYCIQDVDKNPSSTEVIAYNNSQSKLKESKEIKETISKEIAKKRNDDCENKEKTDTSIPLEVRRQAFYDSLIPYLEERGGKYKPAMIRKFFDHWSQVNPNGKKMKWEKERDKKGGAFELSARLRTWAANDEEWSARKTYSKGSSISEAIASVCDVQYQSDMFQPQDEVLAIE